MTKSTKVRPTEWRITFRLKGKVKVVRVAGGVLEPEAIRYAAMKIGIRWIFVRAEHGQKDAHP